MPNKRRKTTRRRAYPPDRTLTLTRSEQVFTRAAIEHAIASERVELKWAMRIGMPRRTLESWRGVLAELSSVLRKLTASRPGRSLNY